MSIVADFFRMDGNPRTTVRVGRATVFLGGRRLAAPKKVLGDESMGVGTHVIMGQPHIPPSLLGESSKDSAVYSVIL